MTIFWGPNVVHLWPTGIEDEINFDSWKNGQQIIFPDMTVVVVDRVVVLRVKVIEERRAVPPAKVPWWKRMLGR